MKTPSIKIVSLLAIIAIISFLGLVFIVPEGDYIVPIGKDSAHVVSQEFLRAMADHQEGRLKSLSMSILWPKLDHWLNNHQEVDCGGPLWWEPLDSSPFSSEIISNEPNRQRMHLALSRECQKQEIIYCARVSDLKLVLTNEGWLVEDWEHLNEQLLPSTTVCRIEQ